MKFKHVKNLAKIVVTDETFPPAIFGALMFGLGALAGYKVKPRVTNNFVVELQKERFDE